MSEIQNTTQFIRDGGAYLLLAEAMGGKDPDKIITDMEAAGQRQLVASQQLPTEVQSPDTDADFEALGFTLAPPSENDPMFRPATLPPGWTKRASDHDMWSYVVDELGRDRVAVFYKAAFYDRRAFMRLESVESYLRTCQYYDRPVLTDETWATPREIAAVARSCAGRTEEEITTWRTALQEGRSVDYATERIPELEAERDGYIAIATRFEAPETETNS